MTNPSVSPACQLYLISPPVIDDGFIDRLKSVLEAAPMAAFQFRVKDMDEHSMARIAEPLQRVCADHDTAFIINDSISLAKRLGADGVHLGQSDGDPRDARERLGRDAQIGVTCHNSRHLAMEAGEAGADYVAFGAFYPTLTKSVDHYAEPDLLTWWSSMFELPCVAIGGINAGNVRPLVDAGADFIAISGAVWGCTDGPVVGTKKIYSVISNK